MPFTWKRKWFKNISWSLVVGLSIFIALSTRNWLGKFMSLAGTLTCTPIAFILPAAFHLKLKAVTDR